MRLILFEGAQAARAGFHPVALGRPLWELHCGMHSLRERITARFPQAPLSGFVPDYMADAYRAVAGDMNVNDASMLRGQDLLILNARIKNPADIPQAQGQSQVGLADDGEVVYARVRAAELAQLPAQSSLEGLLEQLKAHLPNVPCHGPLWRYCFELVLANAQMLRQDFVDADRHGIEGAVEQPSAIRGSPRDVYVAPGARVHPMTVLDATAGPIYIDEQAEIQPFTRVEGPCYLGRGSILLGAKCRQGMSIGPMCRVGGEVEESIIQGWSNKYHDGFLGHAYMGSWVNLGALTANSDLKNDYSSISVSLDGSATIDTGAMKMGAIIGDHAKTSIGTLFNTGSVIGAFALVVAGPGLLPRFIPSFSWCLSGRITNGRGKASMFQTAATVMARRGCQWSPSEQAMWEAVYEMTAEQRCAAIEKSARKAVPGSQ